MKCTNIYAQKCTTIFSGIMNIPDLDLSFFCDRPLWQDILAQMKVSHLQELPLKNKLKRNKREYLNHIYYSDFINLISPEENATKKEMLESVNQYTISVNKSIDLFSNDILIFVESITFNLFPNDVLIYSIDVVLDELSYNDIFLIVSCIRNITEYSNSISQDFINLFYPIILMYNDSHKNKKIEPINNPTSIKRYGELMEKGNKLKIYLITLTNNVIQPQGYSLDNLLYELSTCSPIYSSIDSNILKPSQQYFDFLIKSNTISCFNNWKAMVLEDSFVVVMNECDDFHFQNWIDVTYKYIYLNILYCKYALIKMNKEYFVAKNLLELEKKYLIFDRAYNWKKISYNFLPQTIYDKIRDVFDVNNEFKLLYENVRKIIDWNEKRRKKRIDILLSILTLVASLSALKAGIDLSEDLGFINKGDSLYEIISYISIGIFFLLGIGLCVLIIKRE